MQFVNGANTLVTPSTRYNQTKVTPSAWQNVSVCENGTVDTSDRNVIEWFIDLTFRINESQLTSVNNFFHTVVKYQLLPFTFTPDPNLNAGAGFGTAVTCYLWQNSISYEYVAPGRIQIKLLLRAYSTSGGFPS